jgi:hypothetical protein
MCGATSVCTLGRGAVGVRSAARHSMRRVECTLTRRHRHRSTTGNTPYGFMHTPYIYVTTIEETLPVARTVATWAHSFADSAPAPLRTDRTHCTCAHERDGTYDARGSRARIRLRYRVLRGASRPMRRDSRGSPPTCRTASGRTNRRRPYESTTMRGADVPREHATAEIHARHHRRIALSPRTRHTLDAHSQSTLLIRTDHQAGECQSYMRRCACTSALLAHRRTATDSNARRDISLPSCEHSLSHDTQSRDHCFSS